MASRAKLDMRVNVRVIHNDSIPAVSPYSPVRNDSLRRVGDIGETLREVLWLSVNNVTMVSSLKFIAIREGRKMTRYQTSKTITTKLRN